MTKLVRSVQLPFWTNGSRSGRYVNFWLCAGKPSMRQERVNEFFVDLCILKAHKTIKCNPNSLALKNSLRLLILIEYHLKRLHAFGRIYRTRRARLLIACELINAGVDIDSRAQLRTIPPEIQKINRAFERNCEHWMKPYCWPGPFTLVPHVQRA